MVRFIDKFVFGSISSTVPLNLPRGIGDAAGQINTISPSQFRLPSWNYPEWCTSLICRGLWAYDVYMCPRPFYWIWHYLAGERFETYDAPVQVRNRPNFLLGHYGPNLISDTVMVSKVYNNCTIAFVQT